MFWSGLRVQIRTSNDSFNRKCVQFNILTVLVKVCFFEVLNITISDYTDSFQQPKTQKCFFKMNLAKLVTFIQTYFTPFTSHYRRFIILPLSRTQTYAFNDPCHIGTNQPIQNFFPKSNTSIYWHPTPRYICLLYQISFP